MKNKYLLLSLLSISLLAFSCIRKPDPIPDPTLDLNFKFSTRSEMTISVSAINEQGVPSPGTLFSIYAENPFIGEDTLHTWAGISPIYRGYTESNGTVSVKLSIPNSAKQLYIVPDYAGYGSMVTAGLETANISVELIGTQLPETKASMRVMAESDNIERDRIKCGINYYFYTSYQADVDYVTATGAMLMGDLVSSDPLSNEFKEMVNATFPDSGNDYELNKSYDIVVTEDGTKIWLTYIGDNGYSTSSNKYMNSIMYYTYQNEDELPIINNRAELKNYIKSDLSDISYAFINTYFDYLACGTKVQLLYWNGEKYVEDFPAGTKVGFALMLNGYKKNYTTMGFNMKEEYIIYSTPKMNYRDNNETRALIFREPSYDCFIMGLEYGFGEDRDFNDALVKISTSKDIRISNEPETPAPSYEIASTHQGTLAFEDLWPYIGDYDFNDFVTDYKYEFTKVRGTNNISSIKVTFSPRAIGAGENNGFGIEFPFAASALSIEGATLEEGTSNGTVIVFNNTRDAFGGKEGEINTSPSLPHIDGTPITFTISFQSPIADNLIPVSSLNPFLYKANNRGKEIHLVDHAPTSQADLSFLGTAYDKSYAPNGTYYRMDNKFPWALDVASTGANFWRYPIERVNITSAYLNYSQWVEDHNGNWFDWTVPGNAVEANLY